MAPKIQHKRSSTQDNPPNAGDLAAGEIAINTNQNSANIHFEDSAGGVRSVGADPTAVGNYSRRVATVNGVGTWVAEGSGAPANGTYGHWTRNDTSDTLSPKTAGDDIVTTGDMQAGNFVIDQTTADVTVTAADPGAARTYTFPDAGGNRNITLDPTTPASTTVYARQVTDAGVTTWVEQGSVAPDAGGNYGYWSRDDASDVLSPRTAGDDVKAASFIIDQTTADVTVTASNPAAARTYTFPDAGGNRDITLDPDTPASTTVYSRQVTAAGVASWVVEGSQAPATNGSFGYWTRDNANARVRPRTSGDSVMGDDFVFDTTNKVTLVAENPTAARIYTFPAQAGNRNITIDPPTPGSTTKYVRQITDAGVGSWVEEGTAPGTGTFGYWTRSGTNLSPKTNGDALTNVGNITGQAALTIQSGGNSNITLQPGGTGQTNIGKYVASGSQRVLFRSAATTSAYRFYNENNSFYGGFRFPSTLTANRNYTWQNASGTVALVNAGTVDPRYVRTTGDSMTGTLNMEDADITLEDSSGDTTIQLDASTGDVQMASQNGGQLAGLRNQFINGDMRIDQRFSFAIQTGNVTNDYIIDRWVGGANANALAIDSTRALVSTGPTPAGISTCLRYRDTSNPLASKRIRQAVELPQAGSSGPFGVGTVWTVSYWSNQASRTDTVNLIFRNGQATGDDTSALATPVAVELIETVNDGTRDWYRYAAKNMVITGTPNANNLCLVCTINLPSGVDQLITGCQLEPGPVATPFEMRPIGTELGLCQRYYQAISRIVCNVYRSGTQNTKRFGQWIFSVPMRTKPTVTFTRSGGTSLALDSVMADNQTQGFAGEAGAEGAQYADNCTADAEL